MVETELVDRLDTLVAVVMILGFLFLAYMLDLKLL